MSLPNLAEDLIAAAEHLEKLGTEASFRRAISTAYYAVFHQLLDTACERIFLPGLPAELARRNFEHKQIKTAAKNFAEPGPTNEQKKYGLSAGPTEALREFCTHIDDLGDARERADYDLNANHQRSQARQMISLAKAVVEFCDNPAETEEFDCLLLCMLMKSNRWTVR